MTSYYMLKLKEIALYLIKKGKLFQFSVNSKNVGLKYEIEKVKATDKYAYFRVKVFIEVLNTYIYTIDYDGLAYVLLKDANDLQKVETACFKNLMKTYTHTATAVLYGYLK